MRIVKSANCLVLSVLLFWVPARASGIDGFFGHYQGTVDTEGESGAVHHVMDVSIQPLGDGFTLSWSSEKSKPKGKAKRKEYSIDFVRSPRSGVYASAMRKDMFGKPRPLDPLTGEPYVWATHAEDTLKVYMLIIDASGSFEMQVYERRLTAIGLELHFSRLRDGHEVKTISATLRRLR